MQFGDHDRKQVEHDDNDQGIECKFMHRNEWFAERAHRLVRRFVDQVSGTRLKRSRINSGSSDPLRKPVTKGWPKQIGSGDDKARSQLNDQKQEQQGYANACQRVVPDKLLRLAG